MGGKGYDSMIGPSTVTPSTTYIPGQQPLPPWGGFGKLSPPQTVSVTGVTMSNPYTQLPGPSYIAPPGPLGPIGQMRY